MPNRATTTTVDPLGDVPPRGQALRQPNDRDESSTDIDRVGEVAPVQGAQMEQARRDAEGPTRNTDCRSMPSGEADCAQPRDPTLLDDVLVPGGRDAENRRTARHDPGGRRWHPSVAPRTARRADRAA